MTKAITIPPEVRARLSKGMKTLWQDPEFRAKRSAHQSEVMKARWQNPESRAAMLQARKEARAAKWDAQIQNDSTNGVLDGLIVEVKQDYQNGRTEPL